MRTRILATLLLVPLMASAPASEEVSVGMPAWLTGSWSARSADGGWTEEFWTPPRAGLMLGAGRSGKGDALEWWEQTRIETKDGKISFCALPKGQKGACFAATKTSANEIVFENAGHDFPTRVAYRREGDVLLAEISGPGGASPQRWRFTRAS